MLELRWATPVSWVDAVRADLDAFLIDHAACERKAAATGMAFVVRYPDRVEILDPLISFAREELEHFQRVYRVLAERGLRLGPDRKDHYVRRMRVLARPDSEDHLLDRLLIAAAVEARGCERFGLLAEGLREGPAEGDLKQMYRELAHAEARHHGLFVALAKRCFASETVMARLAEVLDAEAAIARELPLTASLH